MVSRTRPRLKNLLEQYHKSRPAMSRQSKPLSRMQTCPFMSTHASAHSSKSAGKPLKNFKPCESKWQSFSRGASNLIGNNNHRPAQKTHLQRNSERLTLHMVTG